MLLELLLLGEFTLLVLFALCFGLRRLPACYLYIRGTLGREHIERQMMESFWFHASFRLLLSQGIFALIIGIAGIPGLLSLAQYLREPLPAGIAPYLGYVKVSVIFGTGVMLFGSIIMFINSTMLKLGFRVVLAGALFLLPITLLTAPLR